MSGRETPPCSCLAFFKKISNSPPNPSLCLASRSTRSTTGNPVFWTGDLNVAHKALDCYNDGAKHLAKQAGLTPEERASFTEQLSDGFVDGFRHMYPEAGGHYTYWSQRAGNRAPNKGLRLDYFICEESMVNGGPVRLADTYMDPELTGSDHGCIIGVFEADAV